MKVKTPIFTISNFNPPKSMVITNDVFLLDLFKDGTSESEVIRNSSRSYVENLEKSGFIYKDAFGYLYLTEKGEVAKRIGVEKYVEMEKFEREIQDENSPREVFLNQVFFTTFCTFSFVLAVILAYIIMISS